MNGSERSARNPPWPVLLVWPFRRKKKKNAKPKRSGSAHARRRQEELRERRRRGKPRGKAHARAERDEEQEIHPMYRAPPGPAVWQWVKRAPDGYFAEGWVEGLDFEDFRRWPRAEAPRVARQIRRHVLDLILEAGRSQWPQEFAGLLRAEKGIIEELVLLPGTVSGDTHAIFQFHMLPSDPDIIGTIHSHPNPIPYPSAADTALFRSHGRVHVIACYPFRKDDWRAFDEASHQIELEVID